MSNDITMKKHSFVKGAFIVTLSIIITKIIGILYVIPFHAVIGDTGGSLYGYAYTIYALFISLASAGIPLAISRIVVEYQTLGFYNLKRRTFRIGRRLSLLLGALSFLIMFLLAPFFAKLSIGGVSGASSIDDITLVIRVISLSIVVIPILGVYRGYFEGHRLMSPPSVSQVIEQLVRVLIIILGSYAAVKFFKLSILAAVCVALLGALFGAIISFVYLRVKLIKNKDKFNDKIMKVNEPRVSDKQIIRKIVLYALPFILIDVFKSLYHYIDMFTVVRGLVKYCGFLSRDAEIIYSMLSTWANKFNMLVLSLATGITVSLIPNLVEKNVKNQNGQFNQKIIQAFSLFLFIGLPMSFGVSFLSKAIWQLFYGRSLYGPSLLSYYIFVGVFASLFTISISVLQVLKEYKILFRSMGIGIITKFVLNIVLLISFKNMRMPAYYGVITASIIGYFIPFVIAIFLLNIKYKVNFEELIRNVFDILLGTIIMVLVLFFVKIFVPFYSTNVYYNILIILLYAFVGSCTYFGISIYTKSFKRIVGYRFRKK